MEEGVAFVVVGAWGGGGDWETGGVVDVAGVEEFVVGVAEFAGW